jgi:hypothetical protein
MAEQIHPASKSAAIASRKWKGKLIVMPARLSRRQTGLG